MKVPLLDLKQQYQTIKTEILQEINKIFESQYFILGPNVAKLEHKIAAYSSTEFAVGVSSGTDALLISLMAAGIGPGDLVITTPYTFFATAGSIVRTGAKPLFADIDLETYNISVEKIAELLTSMSVENRSRVKAVIPVHLYGQCVEMDKLRTIADKYELIIIEDAAQAIGAEYKGQRAGSMGDFGCFSFFPSKNLGAFGDGGIVTTKSSDLNEKLRDIRVHGSRPKYFHKLIGGNFRLDAIQASVVMVKLKYLDEWTRKRQKNAAFYRSLFAQIDLKDVVTLPKELENRHIYNQFVICLREKRDQLKEFLAAQGIGCEIYYPVPLHLQECFSNLGYKRGDFPNSEYAADHTLALPIYPELEKKQLEYVVDQINAFYGRQEG